MSDFCPYSPRQTKCLLKFVRLNGGANSKGEGGGWKREYNGAKITSWFRYFYYFTITSLFLERPYTPAICPPADICDPSKCFFCTLSILRCGSRVYFALARTVLRPRTSAAAGGASGRVHRNSASSHARGTRTGSRFSDSFVAAAVARATHAHARVVFLLQCAFR